MCIFDILKFEIRSWVTYKPDYVCFVVYINIRIWVTSKHVVVFVLFLCCFEKQKQFKCWSHTSPIPLLSFVGTNNMNSNLGHLQARFRFCCFYEGGGAHSNVSHIHSRCCFFENQANLNFGSHPIPFYVGKITQYTDFGSHPNPFLCVLFANLNLKFGNIQALLLKKKMIWIWATSKPDCCVKKQKNNSNLSFPVVGMRKRSLANIRPPTIGVAIIAMHVQSTV